MSTSAANLEAGALSRASKSLVLAGIRYDWAAAVLSTLFMGGVFLDGWAHNHDKVDQSFFTPWHAVFYGGFALYAAFLVGSLLVNHARGYAWRRSLPEGYLLSLVGAAIFAAGGVGDLVWHTLFGIEKSVEALLSPTHLLLGVGITLMVSGPLRAAWLRVTGAKKNLPWNAAGPMLVSMTMVLSLFAFLTQYAHPVVWLIGSERARSPGWLSQPLGISSVLLQSLILMGFVLLAVSRWRLPFGSLALLLGANTLFMSVLNDTFDMVPALFAAGLAGDILLALLKPSESRYRFYGFAFLFPAVTYAFYFAAVNLTSRLTWSIHLWAGTIFLAGMVSLLLALVMSQNQGEAARVADASTVGR